MVEPDAVDQDFLAEESLLGEAELLGDPFAGSIAHGDTQRDAMHVDFFETDLCDPAVASVATPVLVEAERTQ